MLLLLFLKEILLNPNEMVEFTRLARPTKQGPQENGPNYSSITIIKKERKELFGSCGFANLAEILWRGAGCVVKTETRHRGGDHGRLKSVYEVLWGPLTPSL